MLPATPHDALVDFDLSVRIAAGRDDVFSLLADVQGSATGPGSPVLAMDKIPPGPTRVGTRWREVVRLGPLVHMTVWSQVTECVARQRLAMDFRSGGMRGWLCYFLAGDDSTTTLRQREHIELQGPLQVLDGVVRRVLEPRLVARLDEIRVLVESRRR
jgi:hypothetical protein